MAAPGGTLPGAPVIVGAGRRSTCLSTRASLNSKLHTLLLLALKDLKSRVELIVYSRERCCVAFGCGDDQDAGAQISDETHGGNGLPHTP